MERFASKNEERLRVFLCYASEDKGLVRQLFARLVRNPHLDLWLDERRLVPGQNWELEIAEAISATHIVIVCLSGKSVSKEGFVQKELRQALEMAKEKPEGTIFLAPVRLDNCTVPTHLRKQQYADLFQEDGYERLMSALRIRAAQFGLSITPEAAIDEISDPPISHESVAGDWAPGLQVAIDTFIAEAQRVSSVPDGSDQLHSATAAALSFRSRFPQVGGHESILKGLVEKLQTQASAYLSPEEVLVLAAEPQAYLPGVVRLLQPHRLIVDSFRFVAGFERSLREGCSPGDVVTAMYATESRGRHLTREELFRANRK